MSISSSYNSDIWQLEQGRETDHGIAIVIHHIGFNLGFFGSSLRVVSHLGLITATNQTHNQMN